ncbi:SRPBCC family protein [Chryseosolibacter indicus]|uniref:SRPBCC domain-containing protein n=1 Tax=Chryseosolibacter indicus TaxID=2782351 RepID=A0ABS5VXG2_9BACT|nr:SRPBCC domain-containing protein [Chryseosolibacter indicus]MBT1706098.1 SRPBCC domain-containing protein [Chryseosolibacter indicus]
MEHLEYTIEIFAPAKKVWDTMLNEETYKQWVSRSWPNSFYIGEWKEGREISFLSQDGGGGTLALLEEVVPYERILAKHVAVLDGKGNQERRSEFTNGWIGTKEEYWFSEENGRTTLKVIMETSPAWVAMFDEGWPGALQDLKNLCEKQAVVA